MRRHQKKLKGFTLVEVMIVVVIIGILAVIAVPRIFKVKQSATASRIVNDFRVFSAAFQNYSLETGAYPPDGAFNQYPQGMEDYLGGQWLAAPLGGQWIWDQDDWGITAGVSLRDSALTVEQMVAIDSEADDGDLAAGRLQMLGGGDRLTYLIEE